MTNISNYLENPKSFNEFRQILFQSITDNSLNPIIKPITNQEAELINQICKSKFETWDWIYGYTPKYVFRNNFKLSNQVIILEIQVEKGIIKDAKMNFDLTQNIDYQYVCEVLLNVKHDYKSIFDLLLKDKKINSLPDFNIHEFCISLF